MSSVFIICIYICSMIDAAIILRLCSMEEQPNYTMLFIQDLLHPVYDEIYINEINSILIELQQLSKGIFDFESKSKKDCISIYASAERLNKLVTYQNFLKHPIHINEFKDKYGNKFIQARTSLMDKQTKKLKNISAYVGSYTDYPKGIHSPEAILKGKMLVRKKLEAFFQLK